MVEKTLGELNCIWVTHNPQQAKRISTAGTLTMRKGDNSESHSPSAGSLSDVFVEEDGLRGHGKGNNHDYDHNSHSPNKRESKERSASASTTQTKSSTSSGSERHT